ncbi:MAG: transporter family protein [Planctomycetota bacterium]|jgi:hypothetical protein
MSRTNLVIALSLFLAVLVVAPALGQDGNDEDLAKKSQNPVSDLISVPFENNILFDVGPEDATVNALLVKPVYPVNLGEWNLINRFIMPVIYQDEIVKGQGSEFGLGDITYQAFFSPAAPGKAIWGLGPAITMPTHTDSQLGADTWSAGPSFVILTMPDNWVLGVLAQNVWDFAGDDDEPEVNLFTLQPIINYNLDEGWYLTSTPVITADWEADSSNTWTVPVGGGIGKLHRFGKMPVDFKLAAYWNAEKPDGSAEWTLQFTVKMLFPK